MRSDLLNAGNLDAAGRWYVDCHDILCCVNAIVKRPIGFSGLREGTPLSLADQAYLAIRDMLIELELPAGEPINELQLTRRLRLGRTPVREANEEAQVRR